MSKLLFNDDSWSAEVCSGADTPFGDPAYWYVTIADSSDRWGRHFATQPEAWAFVHGVAAARQGSSS